MTLQRWIRRPVSLAALALAGAASVSLAQAPLVIGQPRVLAQNGRADAELFEWTGRVDREVQVVMRGNDVWTNNVGQTEYPRARMRVYGRVPRDNGQVTVQLMNGRGDVDVIQQPSRSNNFTTIVRIRDRQSGSADYRLVAYWDDYANGSNGDVYGDGRRDNRRDNRRDDDVYRRRDRDDDNGINNGNNGNNGRFNSEMLHWSGNVDGELEIRIQNGRVEYRTLSGSQPTSIRANPGAMSAPRSNAITSVVQNQGRGSVSVVQQPSAWNGYTTVLRVRDPQGGYGYYDFSLIWQ